MSYLRCSNCGRSLKFAYAGEGYRIYGPVCADKLGIKPAVPERIKRWPDKPSRAVRRPRNLYRRQAAQWGQLLLELVL